MRAAMLLVPLHRLAPPREPMNEFVEIAARDIAQLSSARSTFLLWFMLL
jgi:hypothetical protein